MVEQVQQRLKKLEDQMNDQNNKLALISSTMEQFQESLEEMGKLFTTIDQKTIPGMVDSHKSLMLLVDKLKNNINAAKIYKEGKFVFI